jgi:hypothetical protein
MNGRGEIPWGAPAPSGRGKKGSGGRIMVRAATVLCAIAAAGCTGTGGEQAGSTVYDDAGNCVKDREALSEILVQPVACVSSAECPPGSFCNGETGQCDWECYTDSDCGFSATCSCDGICQDGSPPGSGSTEDPACPRDLDLLQATAPDPDIHDRECTRDEHCPYGARCDDETHRCDYDCLADTDCTSGTVCDCRGECVEPGCAAPVPERTVPTVEVTPDVISVLPGNTWGKQTFSIRITDPDGTIADPDPVQHPAGLLPRARIEAPTPEGLGNLGIPQSTAVAETVNTYAGVHFSTTEETNSLAHANTASSATLTSGGVPSAIADRMVAARPFATLAAVLDVDGAGASTLQALKTATQVAGPACTTQVRELVDARWIVDTTNGYTATTSVSVSRCTAADSYPRDLHVSVYFVDATDTTKVVQHLAYRTVQIDDSGASDITPTDPTGEFSGYLVLENATGDPLTIPIRAWGTQPGEMLVFDDLKLLSATGWFDLSTAASTYLPYIDQNVGNGGGGGNGQDPGILSAELHDCTDELLTGGRRNGVFQMTIPTSPEQPLSFRYRLVYRGTDPPPATSGTMPPAAENLLSNISDAWRTAADPAQLIYRVGSGPPIVRRRIIEQFLCHDYDDDIIGNSPPIYRSDYGGDNLMLVLSPASGDLQCSFGGPTPFESMPPTAMGLITGWDRWLKSGVESPTLQQPVTNPPEEAHAWLDECLDNLTRDVPALDGSSGANATWFGAPGACINLAQLFPAIGYLVHDDVDGVLPRYMDRADAGLFQRLLGQWLDVHAFILQQGVEESRAERHLELIDDSEPQRSLLEDVLARTERGWDVILDQNYLDVLLRLPRDNLAKPDYRVPRPTSYWTFDPEDRVGGHVLDVAGEHHLDVSGSFEAEDWGIHSTSATSATLPYGVLSPYGDVTVSFWFKPDLMANGFHYVLQYDNGIVVRVNIISPGDWRIRLSHSGFNPYWETAPISPMAGWNHIAVVRRHRTYVVYHNGDEIGSFTWTDATANPSGAVASTTFLNSASLAIDDLAVWEQALTLWEVQQVETVGRSEATDPRPLLESVSRIWRPDSTFYEGDNPNYEQGLGLPVKIAETAAQHAGAVEAYSQQKQAEVYGGCYLTGTSIGQALALQRAAASLRYVTAAEVLAVELREKAGEVVCTADLECTAAGGTTCGPAWVCLSGAATLDIPPSWDARYQEAMSELAAVRGRAVASMRRLQACENPLGIPEDDLPIYFGDVEGTNSRYFASSDYLSASWARPSVQSATYSLEAAREGWLAKRDSDIRQQMNEFEAERRLEGIELAYAQPVMDACGITAQDGLEVLDGDIDPTTCFRVPGCTPANDPACLRGSLGQAMLGVLAAGEQLIVEGYQSNKRARDWGQQMKTCELSPSSLLPYRTQWAEYKSEVAQTRVAASILMSDVFGDLEQLLDTTVGGAVDASWAADLLAACLAGNTYAGAIACVADPASPTPIRQAIQSLEFAFQAVDVLFQLGNEDHDYLPVTEYPCWQEVGRYQREWLHGMDAVVLRQADLRQAWNFFEEQTRATARQIAEAKSALEREQGRTLPSVAHHYWVDEKIARFQRDFARAKRFTYLAMRAVEYEFQQSLGLRTQILTASHPDDLVEALDVLDAERATRSINSRRPAPGTEVLSLRTDILALGDLQPTASGERASTAALRLQDVLTSPEYAYYDDNGEYLGQAIPFALSESGALRHRCGERLWRVTATIQGDLTDVDEPRAQVFLLKRNVFKSQWCGGLGDETPYQQGSTAGGSNLFTADATTVGRQGSEYTPALIYPWYNVRRSDFYRDDYTQGSSDELAGRGLYGEYVLLFPKYGMLEPPADCAEANVCTEGTSPGCSDPFRDLRRIEDVLIRFDYLSVDDL